MKRVTREQLRQLIADHIESDEPDAVLEVFRAQAGKPLTKRILAKLPGGEERWQIDQIANMTHVQTREYGRMRGNSGISLLVAYATKGITIDPAFLEKHNAAYFSARKERNVKRIACMNDAQALDNLADAVNAVLAAQEALAKAKTNLENYIAYDRPFDADRYAIKALVEVE